MRRLLSLGVGVQSSTLYLMAVHGDFGEERPEAAIFADTQWEPRAVYEWLAELERIGGGTIPIRRVTAGDIRQAALTRVDPVGGKPYRRVSLPLYVAVPQGLDQTVLWDLPPTVRAGALFRQCTKEFKLSVIRQAVREHIGVGPRSPVPEGTVEQWIGISTDEADRQTSAGVKFVVNRYPLIERGMSRDDCITWLAERGYPEPAKSACIGCPFTSDARWAEMQENRPEEFAEAVAFDEAVRHGLTGVEHPVYLHRSLRPLSRIAFNKADTRTGFSNDCQGVCGV